MLAVVDTNVVVAGLLTSDPASPTAQVLDRMLNAEIRFVLSVELLAEYRLVLLRPPIATAHGLAAEEVDVLLRRLAADAILREPTTPPEGCPDPGDEHLWGLLAAVPGAVLVTGDRRLVESPPRFARVLSPATFLGLLDCRGG